MKEQRCVIIGSSPETDVSEMGGLLKKDDYIICADGGYIFAQMLGIKPDLIVGDFDSSESPVQAECEIIRLPVRKDETDTHYAVRKGLERGCREFLLCGVSGGRADHTYANFCLLKFLLDQGAHGIIADGGTVIFVEDEGEISLDGKNGYGFGIFPFGCDSCRVTLEGFDYPLQNGILDNGLPLSVSNRISSDNAKVTVLEGTVIMFLYKY